MVTFTRDEVIALAEATGYPLNTTPEGDSELDVIMLGQCGSHIEQIEAWMEGGGSMTMDHAEIARAYHAVKFPGSPVRWAAALDSVLGAASK